MGAEVADMAIRWLVLVAVTAACQCWGQSQVAPPQGDPLAAAQAEFEAGSAARKAGQLPEAAAHLQKALAILRTEKVLRPGLGPEMYEMLQGRKAARDVPAGEGITWEDL